MNFSFLLTNSKRNDISCEPFNDGSWRDEALRHSQMVLFSAQNEVLLSASLLRAGTERKRSCIQAIGVKFLSGVALIGVANHTRFRGFRCLALVVAGGFWDGNIPARGVR